jgi:hypothetical protein
MTERSSITPARRSVLCGFGNEGSKVLSVRFIGNDRFCSIGGLR